MRREVRVPRGRAALFPVVMLAAALALVPRAASAGFLDFLFGGGQPVQSQPAQPDSTADPMANPALSGAGSSGGNGRFTSYCVRTCDGKFFPLSGRSGVTPAQICQAFCPASATKVYSGNSIDYAVGPNGERYADLPNAFAYRKALRADCTCNGRDPAGLAPVDLSLDTTLRPGDVVATANGLVAYSGIRVGNAQTAEFTPVANYPGLTADVRAKLGEMKVAPVSPDITGDDNTDTAPDTTGSVPPIKPQPAPNAKRADDKVSSARAEMRGNRPAR